MKFLNVYFFFPNNKSTTTKMYSFKYSRTTSQLLSLFIGRALNLLHMHLNLVINGQISNKRYILRTALISCTTLIRGNTVLLLSSVIFYQKT